MINIITELISSHVAPVVVQEELSSKMIRPSTGISVGRSVGDLLGGLRLTTIGLNMSSGEGAGAVSEVLGFGLTDSLPLGLGGVSGFSDDDEGLELLFATVALGGGCVHTGGGGLITISFLEGSGVGALYEVGLGVGCLVGLSVTFIMSITLSKLSLLASFLVIWRLEHLVSWQSRTKTLLTVSMNGYLSFSASSKPFSTNFLSAFM